MGYEARCTARVGRATSEGKALLETDELIFRGDFRLKIPFTQVTAVDAAGGQLTITHVDGKAVLTLGAAAERWAERIRTPKSLIDKMGIKAGSLVSVLAVDDAAFLRQLSARVPHFFTGRAAKESDIIVVGLSRPADLARIAELASALKPDGALWVVHPKGTPGVADVDIFAAGKAAGLTATKVVRFSATHTGEKLVVPLAKRTKKS